MSFLCGKWIFNWVSQKVAPVPNPKYNLFRICNAVILLRLPFGMLMIRATWPGSYNYRYSTVLLLPREAVFRIRIQGPRQKQPGSRSGNGFRFLTGSGFKEYLWIRNTGCSLPEDLLHLIVDQLCSDVEAMAGRQLLGQLEGGATLGDHITGTSILILAWTRDTGVNIRGSEVGDDIRAGQSLSVTTTCKGFGDKTELSVATTCTVYATKRQSNKQKYVGHCHVVATFPSFNLWFSTIRRDKYPESCPLVSVS